MIWPLTLVFWRRGTRLGSSLQVPAWLWPWLFCSQLWDLLSKRRWVTHVWIKAAGWLHYQMDALYWASLNSSVLSTLLYLFYFMSVIPFISPFSCCSRSLRPSASISLTTHLFPAPAHLGSSLQLCCTLQPFLQLIPSAIASLPSQHVAIAPSRSLGTSYGFMQILLQNESAVLGGGEGRETFRNCVPRHHQDTMWNVQLLHGIGNILHLMFCLKT